ncbi:hypothetical protein [Actinomycetospora chiangmaiensis]|uniref:hypothetical protein n=1 Tax=Actinomycetospora chiangmaiensis TaxID=402650 RepID=UPI0012F9C8EB|nr:hypothetical protein [Actinomycetospora chiangmaiensis]
MLDLVNRSYRGRVALEWRAAVVVAAAAALVAVLGPLLSAATAFGCRWRSSE